MQKEKFSIVAHERGFHNPSLPTWTDTLSYDDIFDKDFDKSKVKRVEIEEVPGAFQLLNVLSKDETQKLIDFTESLGYDEDSPVSLPHDVRHNENFNWVVSEVIDKTIWDRSKHLVHESWQGEVAKGINARFRFYRYKEGDFFKIHTDGAWPGSRVIDGTLVHDAYNFYSQYTYLILLSDEFEGGSTQFLVDKTDPTKPSKTGGNANVVNIRTPRGGVLCFPHGTHPMHCLHSSEEIKRGTKYIIRTDILFGKE